jgi:hypothetical protein
MPREMDVLFASLRIPFALFAVKAFDREGREEVR